MTYMECQQHFQHKGQLLFRNSEGKTDAATHLLIIECKLGSKWRKDSNKLGIRDVNREPLPRRFSLKH